MIYKNIEICEVRTSFGDACLKLYKITGHTFPDAEKNSLSALYHSHFYYECHILTAGVRKARQDFFPSRAEELHYRNGAGAGGHSLRGNRPGGYPSSELGRTQNYASWYTKNSKVWQKKLNIAVKNLQEAE